VGSHIERGESGFYHSAVLLSPDGKLVASYRQTHVSDGDGELFLPGDEFTVVETSIGRIGMLLSEDVRYPEASGVLALRRADLIAIPTHWSGEYGAYLLDAEGLFAHGYPANTVNFWYSTAKTSQAFTVVANHIGRGSQGSSGVFTINPVDAFPPIVASVDKAESTTLTVPLLGESDWWMNQHKLISGRRADLAVPLRLATDSPEFIAWRDGAGFPLTWAAYEQ
jgi:predicted amidohydrolase